MYTATAARNRFVSDGVGSTPPEKLLVMLYDRLLRDLDEAAQAILGSEVGPAHEALSHAQDIVAELHSALDPAQWDGAEAMGDLYTWLAELLGRSNMQKSVTLVEEARAVVAPLRDTWAEAYQTMQAQPEQATIPPHAGGLDVAG
jgi:flagellar secretion chaperone FliS